MKFPYDLSKYIDEKLVFETRHPNEDLFIYNYSPKVQFEKLWDEVTLQCRGLILDSEGNIIAKPFGKFFNLEERLPSEIPSTNFDVYEKLDGSLGIVYFVSGLPYIATRGSFTSDQAQHANRILHTKYKHIILDESKTYLFEIIYPDNRIVVNYGDLDDLVLLSIIDKESGIESLEDIGFPIVRKYNGLLDWRKLKELQEPNREGFVLRFNNGFRVKVKFDEYVRLHRILTGVSNIAIWEYLSNGEPLDHLLEKVPDEFYNWVFDTSNALKSKFNQILSECESVYKEMDSRKETALYFQTQKYPSVLFAMYDKKNWIDKIIWKMVRPQFSKAFKKDDI